MSETKGGPFNGFLPFGPKPFSLTLVSDSCGDSCQRGSCHSKDIRVEAMRPDDADIILSEKVPESPKLDDKIPIVEAGERILENLTGSDEIRFAAQ
jgi:hypothetical protein